jgi:hypothetical protein
MRADSLTTTLGARGPLSAAALDVLLGSSSRQDDVRFREAAQAVPEPLVDGDYQLALALCYEPHYRGLPGLDAVDEWDPALLALRACLEQGFERALHRRCPTPGRLQRPVWDELASAVHECEGPDLSGFLARRATAEQVRQWLRQKSVYHLREADAHTWAIPRLRGPAKAALVAIQADEYGGGRCERMHSTMFADTLRAADLDASYGAYWGCASAQTLASLNLISLLGLHRRLRGALAGHLAAFEMTSTEPNRLYARAVRRAGMGETAAAFFDEHVEADAVHEQLAAVDLCGALAEEEPDLGPQIVWGARCALAVDADAAGALLEQWHNTEELAG